MLNKKNTVFAISMGTTVSAIIFAIFFNKQFSWFSNNLYSVITDNFSWLYLLAMFAFVCFVVYIAFSKYGSIRLGADDEKPEYSTFSWFAMLFCAGMGIGLVFWGISEPLVHYTAPQGVAPCSPEAATFAYKSIFMHWGIHPWANYAVIGLSLAYFQFRKNKPALISSVLEPVIGEKGVKGGWGNFIDILASFATVGGIVTSMGLGALQINSGLHKIFGVSETLTVQIVLIAIVTCIFVWSAVSGISKGVKFLSNLNLILAFLFMLGAIIVGPKLEMVHNFVGGLGAYLGNFVEESLSISGYGDNSWIKAWKIFYEAWWIAWAPFSGAFIARISRGRTIREFILGVVLAPTVASFIWFSIFGSLGIHLGAEGIVPMAELQQAAAVPEEGLFFVLSQYPFGQILSVIAIILLFTFFITSADSGTYVLAMLSSEGAINAPTGKKIAWGIAQSVLAVGLLICGGLKPLQTISIVVSFPFIFVMITACISLCKALKTEKI